MYGFEMTELCIDFWGLMHLHRNRLSRSSTQHGAEPLGSKKSLSWLEILRPLWALPFRITN